MLTLEDLLVQPSNSGGFSGASGTASLPTPTTAGSTVLIVCGSSSVSMSATGFTDDGGTNAFILRKSNVGAGETSWALTAQTGTLTRWTAYELAGLDPAYPVDVKTSIPTSTSSGTTASTGTSPRSTTYDGLVLAVHASHNSVSTTPTTFSGHTNGMTEMDEGSFTDATLGDAVALSVSMKTVQQLGTFESTATTSATLTATNQTTALIVCYAAEGAKREPAVTHFWSFPPEMAGLTSLHLGLAGSRYFENQAGSPVILAGGGLQLASTAAAEWVLGPSHAFQADPQARAVVLQVKFRFDGSLPSVNTDLVSHNGSQPTVLRYVAASQKLGYKLGTGSEVLSDATVTADTWLTVDLRMVTTATPSTTMTGDWQVDYGAGPVVQTQATAAVSTGVGSVFLGWTGTITVPGVTYVHLIASNVAGHYPLTSRWAFPFLKPDVAGTITARSGTTADLRRFTANGTIAGSFNSADIIAALRDWPPVFGASADGAAIITASTGTYAIPMETYAASGVGSIRTVMVLGAMWAAAATAATHQLNGHDGSASTTLLPMADYNADTGSAPPWVAKLWRPTDGWTLAKLDAAALDLLSNDATPDVGWHCLGMVAAVRLADQVMLFGASEDDPLNVRQDLDPDTQGIIGLVATNLSGRAATLTYELNGVEQTPVDLPDGTDGLSIPINAPDMPTVSRISLIPSP